MARPDQVKPQHKIGSMSAFEGFKGTVDWDDDNNAVLKTYKEQLPGKSASQTLIYDVAPKCGSDGDMDPNELETQLLLMYVHALMQAGESNWQAVFERVYNMRFRVPDGVDMERIRRIRTIPEDGDQIIAQLTALHGAETAQQRAGFTSAFTASLQSVKRAARAYGITNSLPDNDPGEVVIFSAELERVIDELHRSKDALANNVTRRPAGNIATFLCIQQEHAASGKKGPTLNVAAVADFATFAVSATSIKVEGAIKTGVIDAATSLPEAGWTEGKCNIGEAVKARSAAMVDAFAREGAGALVARFPLMSGLTLSSPESEIKKRMEQVPIEKVVALIGFLRNKIAQRESSEGPKDIVKQGIKKGDLAEVAKFIGVLEGIVTVKLQREILEGDAAGLLDRVQDVTSGKLQRVLEKATAALAKELTEYNPPKLEGKAEGSGSGFLGSRAGQWLTKATIALEATDVFTHLFGGKKGEKK